MKIQQYDMHIPYASLHAHAKRNLTTEKRINRMFWIFASREERAKWKEQEKRSIHTIETFKVLADDEAKAKAAELRLARKKDPHMIESRLPKTIEEAICAVDDAHLASCLRHYLGFGGDNGMRDCFLEALQGTDVHVWEDQAETDPCEIVVRATGQLESGSHIFNLNIILLDPSWSKAADVSHQMASRIIEVWDEISQIAKTNSKD